MIYRYPIRHDLGRGLDGGHSRNQNSQQLQRSKEARDANLSHMLPRGLGLDNLTTRELWGAYEDGIEEVHENSPEMSEANSNVTNHVWMRGGGGGGGGNSRKNWDDSPTPGPSRSPRRNKLLNLPLPSEDDLVAANMTRYPEEKHEDYVRRRQRKITIKRAERAEEEKERLSAEESARYLATMQRAARDKAVKEKAAREEVARERAAQREDAGVEVGIHCFRTFTERLANPAIRHRCSSRCLGNRNTRGDANDYFHP
ncbi:hypothetical protein N431DRAFT_552764, partial [Stipitochalara longipes BDJ]